MVYIVGKELGAKQRVRLSSVVLVACLMVSAGLAAPTAQEPVKPTFKTGIEMVSVSAVVRDHKGRVVQDLKGSDFQVFDNGRLRSISDFRSDAAPVNVALLFDTSGSMQVAYKESAARGAAQQLLSWLQWGKDEVAVFAFDSALRELQSFSREEAVVRSSLGRVEEPFGLTSLHDAIGETARQVAARGKSHRAVVVFTDGVDNNSRLTPAQVSGIAGSIDVPVYIVAVVSPLDHGGQPTAVVPPKSVESGALTSLAQWTGGEMFVSSSPAQTSLAVRRIVDELRSQYLIAFEPGTEPGWHPLEIRLRDKRLSVRSRGGYFAGPAIPGNQ